ncbi:MAG: HNH endonuclease [Burkholderiaceae bacterium]|jgi:hypothetical protein|nr:HNH endonuclease [Burkholderiaceae bacterium]
MMRTLEDLRQRCRIDPDEGDDGCWLFDHSHAYVAGAEGTGVMASRRAAWILAHGKPVKAGYRVFGKCGERGCVNPAHLRALDPAEHGRSVAASGALKGVARRVLANRAIGRNRAKLTAEMVAQINASPDTGVALARRYGVSTETISKARRSGYACHGAQTNPWAGLMKGRR